MIGQKVIHKTWGCGIITEFVGGYIKVNFDGNEKKFVYPDAFGEYLATDNPELMVRINNDLQIKRDAQTKIVPFICSPLNLSVTKKRKDLKRTERCNIAFKCNYCDGGKTQTHIGFYGVCSDSVLRYNIEKARHIWCACEDSPCRLYLDGEITRRELESMMEDDDGQGSVCYESHMLRDWEASAGVVQTGVDKGKPMRLVKVQPNSLAVLTTREPYSNDESRFIFAVFLVDQSYQGDNQDAGYVTTNSKWRIELTQQEAHKIRFWNYYFNQNAPLKMVFGSGLHRYLSDEQAAQILRDIVAVKTHPKEKEFAQQFFEHFCTVNNIDAEHIPPPNGALVRNT